MAHSPDGGGLFLSSSPLQQPGGPADEVDAIFERAREVNTIDPDIEVIISEHRGAFTSTFSRRIALIQSRSQAWKDNHVTVFDKVLLLLTRNGNELDTPAAIAYFCKEFLATPESTSLDEKRVALVNAVVLSTAGPIQAMSPPETKRGSFSRSAGPSKSPEPAQQAVLNMFVTRNGDADITLARLAAQLEPITSRLWNVYANSKKEFAAVNNPHSLEKQDAAKFLRDTAENLLHRLRDISADERLVKEVLETFRIANITATTLHGGRKRKFDGGTDLSARDSTPARNVARDAKVNSAREGPRQGKRPKQTTGKEFFPGHTSAIKHHRRNAVDLDREDLYYASPEELPESRRSFKKKKNKGRGHSGIPYGYSRPVDSWYPE